VLAWHGLQAVSSQQLPGRSANCLCGRLRWGDTASIYVKSHWDTLHSPRDLSQVPNSNAGCGMDACFSVVLDFQSGC
jgi:hypothetical protein